MVECIENIILFLGDNMFYSFNFITMRIMKKKNIARFV